MAKIIRTDRFNERRLMSFSDIKASPTIDDINQILNEIEMLTENDTILAMAVALRIKRPAPLSPKTLIIDHCRTLNERGLLIDEIIANLQCKILNLGDKK